MNKIIAWLTGRTGLDAAINSALTEPVPGGARWQYVFGSVLTFLFMQQVGARDPAGILLQPVGLDGVGQHRVHERPGGGGLVLARAAS